MSSDEDHPAPSGGIVYAIIISIAASSVAASVLLIISEIVR